MSRLVKRGPSALHILLESTILATVKQHNEAEEGETECTDRDPDHKCDRVFALVDPAMAEPSDAPVDNGMDEAG
jgi:hypothetical protein